MTDARRVRVLSLATVTFECQVAADSPAADPDNDNILGDAFSEDLSSALKEFLGNESLIQGLKVVVHSKATTALKST